MMHILVGVWVRELPVLGHKGILELKTKLFWRVMTLVYRMHCSQMLSTVTVLTVRQVLLHYSGV